MNNKSAASSQAAYEQSKFKNHIVTWRGNFFFPTEGEIVWREDKNGEIEIL